MPDAVWFPYGIRLRVEGAIEIFPAVKVFFPLKDGEEFSLFLVIDSGATVSALPKSDAAPLGIDAENGGAVLLSGVSGEPIQGWQHEVEMIIGREPMMIPIVFLDSERAPRVLGRAGVFGRFTVVFEEEKRRSGFLGRHSMAARTVSKLLDKAEEK